MQISMYNASVPQLAKMLRNLSGLLDKAAAHCETRKIDPKALLEARLSPDMFTFTKQVQIAADFAKNCAARLAGVEPQRFEDTEASFAELKARIDRTLDYMKQFGPDRIDGSEDRVITYKLGGKERTFKGHAYLVQFTHPHFYFHAATAYDILRERGVDVGKKDFVGAVE